MRVVVARAWGLAAGLAVACGGGGAGPDAGPPQDPASSSAARPSGELPADAGDHARFQRLNAENLELMIEAAKRELDIGAFQARINAATMRSMSDMKDAADQLEQVQADLKAALGR